MKEQIKQVILEMLSSGELSIHTEINWSSDNGELDTFTETVIKYNNHAIVCTYGEVVLPDSFLLQQV